MPANSCLICLSRLSASSAVSCMMARISKSRRWRFVATFSFVFDGHAYIRSFCVLFGVVTVNVFSSVNKNDANIVRWTFLSDCLKWQSLALKFVSLSFGSLRFLNTNISQGSVATRLRCGGIFNQYFTRNLVITCRWKNFENRSAFDKIRVKTSAEHFPGARCRKPVLEFASTTLATFLDDREFSAGCYLFTVSNSRLLFSSATGL